MILSLKLATANAFYSKARLAYILKYRKRALHKGIRVLQRVFYGTFYIMRCSFMRRTFILELNKKSKELQLAMNWFFAVFFIFIKSSLMMSHNGVIYCIRYP